MSTLAEIIILRNLAEGKKKRRPSRAEPGDRFLAQVRREGGPGGLRGAHGGERFEACR